MYFSISKDTSSLARNYFTFCYLLNWDLGVLQIKVDICQLSLGITKVAIPTCQQALLASPIDNLKGQCELHTKNISE